MRLLMFPQWDKLSVLLRTMARQSAADYCQRNIKRVQPMGGRACLVDRAANVLTLDGCTVTVVMPGATPGRAREFVLRLKAVTVANE